MKCNHCGKEVEIVKEFVSDIPGAVIIAHDTDGMMAVWPASLGLTKYEGCVEFGNTTGSTDLSEILHDGEGVNFYSINAEDIYFDTPLKETAWLVTPVRGGYEWERIDDQIEFTY